MQITVQSSAQNLGIESAPFNRATITTQKIMLYVLLALSPAFVVMNYFFGFGVLLNFILSAASALVFEFIVAILRQRKIKHFLSDLSYLVTAMILAMALPPLMPWYLVVVATAFAILLVKHAFGGLGMNIFNPAMAATAFMLIATPSFYYTTYVTPNHNAIEISNFTKSFEVKFNLEDRVILQKEMKAASSDADMLTGATYLESIKTQRKASSDDFNYHADFLASSYDPYLYLAIAYVFGGLLLIILHIIHYHMPLVFLASIGLFSYLYELYDPNISINIAENLLLGGTIMCAFFIITDPVTNSGTLKGRIVFSFFVGFLVVIIRINGSYSDSVAFAILLGNTCAPLIDVLTKRRPFGIGYRQGGLD